MNRDAAYLLVLPVVFLPVVVLLRCCLRSGQHEEHDGRRADHPESDPNAASAGDRVQDFQVRCARARI